MKLDSGTKVYIAGCGGMLGEGVHKLFSGRCEVRATDISVNSPWLSYADLRDHTGMRAEVDKFQPDAIVNLGALTDLEVCERDPKNAWDTNAYGAENLGKLAAERGVPYV